MPARPIATFTAALLTATAPAADSACAAGKGTPAEIAAQRQESLDEMLSEDFQPALIANVRRSCVLGLEPAHVVESRAGGAYFTPDAADSCVTALARTARDGRLPDLYRELLTGWKSTITDFAAWPRAIGAVAMSNATEVQINSNEAVDVTSSLAFDAGFTVAYQDGSAAKVPDADLAQLKVLAESCLALKGKPGPCFAAGYVYGNRAFKSHIVSTR